MSRNGDSRDTAVEESIFATLTTDWRAMCRWRLGTRLAAHVATSSRSDTIASDGTSQLAHD